MKILKASRTYILGALLVISIGINLTQARYISVLLDNKEQKAARGALLAGTKVPPLEVRSLSGQASTISYAGDAKPTILYVFRPSCGWCQRNGGSLNALAARTSGKYRLIGLSLGKEGLADFVASHHMAFPVYAGLTPSTVAAYHLGTTPETIVVSPNGVVLGSWNGAYMGGTKMALERFFAVALPAQLSGAN